MLRFLVLMSFIVVSESLHAQNHDYIWILSKDLQLDFNFSPPKIQQEDLGLHFYYSTASFSDSSGKRLLFYTNGSKVFSGIDRKVMEGGDSVNFNWGPGSAWSEGGYIGHPPVILPLPNSNKYYIFHQVTAVHPILPATVYYPFFIYHVIDMNANNGRGKVIEKNKVIMSGDAYNEMSNFACVKHANGRDWWIAITKSYDPNLYTFLLCPEGLRGPYLQEISPPEWRASFLIFSNTGKFLLKSNLDTMRLYSFDRCSGRVQLLRAKPFDGTNRTIPWWGVFSYGDRFLYLERTFWRLQVDLEAFIDTGLINYNDRQYWELNYYPHYPCDTRNWAGTLAPDKKIYYTQFGPCGYCLNVIHRPNLPGDAADIDEESIYMPDSKYYATSIDLYLIPNYRLSKWEGSLCDTLGVQQTGEVLMNKVVDTFFYYSENSMLPSGDILAKDRLIKAVDLDGPDDISGYYYRLLMNKSLLYSNKEVIEHKNGSTYENVTPLQGSGYRPKE